MSISMEDADQLRAAGFNDYEVGMIAGATTPAGESQPPIDLNNAVWQRAMISRRAWIESKIQKGWSAAEIEDAIMRYYSFSSKRNPFDFLKAEYKPPLRKDFHDSIRRRSQRKITASLSGYGRR